MASKFWNLFSLWSLLKPAKQKAYEQRCYLPSSGTIDKEFSTDGSINDFKLNPTDILCTADEMYNFKSSINSTLNESSLINYMQCGGGVRHRSVKPSLQRRHTLSTKEDMQCESIQHTINTVKGL